MKTYSELILLPTFEERFLYLKTNSKIGGETFGDLRYLNQVFYKSWAWHDICRYIKRRDKYDLAVEGKTFSDRPNVHHLNEVTIKMLINEDPKLLDPENLILCSSDTHRAIHFSNDLYLMKNVTVDRIKNDTIPWR